MLFPIFSSKDSDTWPLKQTLLRHQSLRISSKPCWLLDGPVPFLPHPGPCSLYTSGVQSAQRRYIDFCCLDGRLSPEGALLPADKQSLMRSATMLADSLNHSSIKVYLSAVRSLHIDNGLADPLLNCLQL